MEAPTFEKDGANWTDRLGDVADELVAVETPALFMAVGQHYRDFGQTSDDEVIRCLERVVAHVERVRNGDDPFLPCDDDVTIDLDGVAVGGHLTVPRTRRRLFDIELLAGRLLDVTDWLRLRPGFARIPIGYLGASTGATRP